MATSDKPILKADLLRYFKEKTESKEGTIEEAAEELASIIDDYVVRVVSKITADIPVTTTLSVNAGIDVENLDITPVQIGQTSEAGSGTGTGTAAVRGNLKTN